MAAKRKVQKVLGLPGALMRYSQKGLVLSPTNLALTVFHIALPEVAYQLSSLVHRFNQIHLAYHQSLESVNVCNRKLDFGLIVLACRLRDTAVALGRCPTRPGGWRRTRG